MGEEWANCYCPARPAATTAEWNAIYPSNYRTSPSGWIDTLLSHGRKCMSTNNLSVDWLGVGFSLGGKSVIALRH